jgi:hypothetical protein
MPEIRQILNPTEIPAGTRYILVMPGDRNVEHRHSRGVTIIREKMPGASDDLCEMAFYATVETAKALARAENIQTVFVVPWFLTEERKAELRNRSA